MVRGLSLAVVVLAGLIAAWALVSWEPRAGTSAVAPAPRVDPTSDESHAATDPVRWSIEAPDVRELPQAATPESPPPARGAVRERLNLTSQRLRGFESMERLDLADLERRLTQEIQVSTVDEMRWRFEHGLGELAGVGDDFDIGKAWLHDRIMNTVSPGDGTHWRVSLPREQFPEAYALFDRREAVRAEIQRRQVERARRPRGTERNPNAPHGE